MRGVSNIEVSVYENEPCFCGELRHDKNPVAFEGYVLTSLVYRTKHVAADSLSLSVRYYQFNDRHNKPTTSSLVFRRSTSSMMTSADG